MGNTLRRIFVRVLIGSVLILGACKATDPRPVAIADGAYRDLDPAVVVAAGDVEMAVVDHHEPADRPGLHVYELITATDEPVELLILMPADASPEDRTGGPVQPLEISAAVGRFGDAAREEALVRALRKRLQAVEARGAAKRPE